MSAIEKWHRLVGETAYGYKKKKKGVKMRKSAAGKMWRRRWRDVMAAWHVAA